MDELESRMQRVLDAARDGMSPSADDTARTRRLLLAATAGLAVGVGTGTAAAATTAATTTAAATAAGTTGAAGAGVAASKGAGLFAAISSLSLGTKVVTAVAISASIGSAGIWATRTPSPAPTPVVAVTAAAPSPQRVAPVQPPTVAMPTEPATPEVAPEPAPTPRIAAVAPHAAPITSEEPTTPDPLAAELALIERARQALKRGNPQQALTALAEHRTRFEHGVMTQERVALRALALCSLGDPQGKIEAQRFLERNPGSPLAAHLRTGCK